MIGSDLAGAYRLPPELDEQVFVRIMAKQAGFDVAESELTPETRDAVLTLCRLLWIETPYRVAESWEQQRERTKLRLPPPERPRRSGSEIIEICVSRALPASKATAFRAFRGFHPELRHEPGGLARYRPAARAALARDLRRVARPIIARFALDRFTDTDRYIDEDGVRRPGPTSPQP